MSAILTIYEELLKLHNRQGWWPLTGINGKNPTKTGSLRGYHPGDYHHPKTKKEKFEICLGAILTQNTSWPNVEKAILGLEREKILAPEKILKSLDLKLIECIKPSGYFNQKTKKIRIFSEFYIGLKNKTPARDELLAIWGIGPETADSMLLYAWHVPTFVVDAYTRRIFTHLKLIKEKSSYEQIKEIFEKNLPRNHEIYNEYHALIVEHAKHFYSKKPFGIQCPLKKLI